MTTNTTPVGNRTLAYLRRLQAAYHLSVRIRTTDAQVAMTRASSTSNSLPRGCERFSLEELYGIGGWEAAERRAAKQALTVAFGGVPTGKWVVFPRLSDLGVRLALAAIAADRS